MFNRNLIRKKRLSMQSSCTNGFGKVIARSMISLFYFCNTLGGYAQVAGK